MDETYAGFDPDLKPVNEDELKEPTDKRMFVLAAALKDGLFTFLVVYFFVYIIFLNYYFCLHFSGYSIDDLHELTNIDKWFLSKLKNIINFHVILQQCNNVDSLSKFILEKAKQFGFSDKQIAKLVQSSEMVVRRRRYDLGIHPWVKQIDTLAGLFTF